MPAKSPVTLRRELARVKEALKRAPEMPRSAEAELYGAQQALEWALGRNAMAPARCAALNLPVENDRSDK